MLGKLIKSNIMFALLLMGCAIIGGLLVTLPNNNIVHGSVWYNGKIEASTGSGTISKNVLFSTPNVVQRVTVSFSSKPSTSANFAIINDSANGSAYDVKEFESDLSTTPAYDYIWVPSDTNGVYMESDSALKVAYSNPDNLTWGLQVTTGR